MLPDRCCNTGWLHVVSWFLALGERNWEIRKPCWGYSVLYSDLIYAPFSLPVIMSLIMYSTSTANNSLHAHHSEWDHISTLGCDSVSGDAK